MDSAGHIPPTSTEQEQQAAHRLKGTKLVIMACNVHFKDVEGEWQLVLFGDQTTIAAAGEKSTNVS